MGTGTLLNRALTLAFVLCLLQTQSHAETFEEASESFENGAYEDAKLQFEQLATEHPNDIEIIYALGLINFVLDSHNEASPYFEALLVTEYEQISTYYLAMIAYARGETDTAIDTLNQVADQTIDLEASELASDSLSQIGLEDLYQELGSNEILEPSSNYGYFELGVSQQDGIIDPDNLVGLDEHDSALEYIFAGNLNIRSTEISDTSFGGSVFQQKYSNFDNYDISAINIYVEQQRWFGAQQWGLTLSANKIWLAGQDYLSQVDLQLKDEMLLGGKYIVSFSAKYSDINSDDPLFDRYAGKSSELMVEIRGGSNPYWQIDYTYLYEDKEDWKSIDINTAYTIFDVYTSYSGDVHELGGQLEWSINDLWATRYALILRQSYNEGADLFLVNATDRFSTALTRETQRIYFETELIRTISDNVFLRARYEYLDNDSNIDRFDFGSNLISLSFNYIF
jgi:tetratricopeptide (TPR) repeat protein